MARYRIGHTGITWPSDLDGVARAIADVAALGYEGFETFGATIERFAAERPPGIGPILERHGLPLVSAYCWGSFVDPAAREEDIAQNLRWARMAKNLGASVITLGATRRPKEQYRPDEYHAMAATLSDLGRRIADLGLVAAFHPHTGTPVETREEIDMVMRAVDPEVVFFAPDTGQIQKGGSDPAAAMRAYGARIKHVHLKDYDGGGERPGPDGDAPDRTGYVNYLPVGEGVVDFPAILRLLDEVGYDGWLIVELDATKAATRDPKEAAGASKRHLERFLAASARR